MTFKDKEKEIKKFLKTIKGVYRITIEEDAIDFWDSESERHMYYLDDDTIFFKLSPDYSTLNTAKIVVKFIEFLKSMNYGADE